MKTHAVKASEIDRAWHVVDAEGQVLGRLASEIAQILRGKHKPIFSAHLDTGDFVIVLNAAKVRVTGNKETEKLYRRHSGYPGSMKTRTLANVRATFPERIIEHAVRGMLPSNALGRQMYRKLRVYSGAEHPHEAQRPQPLVISVGRPAKDQGE